MAGGMSTMESPAKLTRVARKPFAVSPATIRSKVANGSRLLEGLDARSAPARRYKDLQASMASDLGNDLTEAQLQLVRTAAGLVVMREALDAQVLNGVAINTGQYTNIANSLKRVLLALGLKRVPKDVTSLGEVLRQGHQRDREASP
jgi:hypothetical protein